MNIHLKDEKEFERLKDSTLVKVEIGSSLFGLKNQNSDSDVMHLTTKSDNLKSSFLWEHHQLQYKSANVDYLFCDVYTFIRNLLSGDSTINFEVIHTEDIKNSCLSFLYEMRKDFYSYNIVKSYLGFAKRDFKYIMDDGKVNGKKASHIYRSIQSAKDILSGGYSNSFNSEHLIVMKSLKENSYEKNVEDLLNHLKLEMEMLRSELNRLLESKQIHRVLSLDSQRKLDNHLKELTNSEGYKAKLFDINKDIFYDALEKGIKY